MVTNVDVRLKYQTETGIDVKDDLKRPLYADEYIMDYINWLEEIAIGAMVLVETAKKLKVYDNTNQ